VIQDFGPVFVPVVLSLCTLLGLVLFPGKILPTSHQGFCMFQEFSSLPLDSLLHYYHKQKPGSFFHSGELPSVPKLSLFGHQVPTSATILPSSWLPLGLLRLYIAER
jgi:hypothetical protein